MKLRQGGMGAGLLLAICQAAFAGDWPQILGPQRNGIAQNETITATAAKPVWQAACGSGLAGVAVSAGRTVLFHRPGAEETLTCLDAATGARMWSVGFPCSYQAQIVNDDGPRAVPTIHNGRVFAYGVQGMLYCVDLQTGKEHWKRATHADFDAPEGYFGAGSAPLVDDQRVIVNVGGRKQGGMVAFDVATGATLWHTSSELASYSAPVFVQRGGESQVLAITRLNFLGLDPVTGKELFRTPFGSRGPTVNAALPVSIGSDVLLTASYGIGARLLEVTARNVVVKWEDDVLSSQYTTPIVHSGAVYGIDGRQDGGPVSLICFDPLSRKIHWKKSGLEYATLIAAGDRLLIMHTNGVLRVAALDSREYRELAELKLMTGTTRALPALSNGCLSIRNESQLAVFDLR